MTKEEEERLQKLETRVRQLILAYKKLEATNDGLREELRQKDNALTEQNVALQQLQERYDNLKTVRIMGVSGEDTMAVKRKIGQLILDVDKCIAMLNILNDKESDGDQSVTEL